MFQFATIVRALAALAFLVCATLAHAQQAPMVGIEPIRATLDQIETQARRSTLGVNALTEICAAHLAAARRPARQACRP